MATNSCVPKTDWFVIGLGFLLMLIGGALTLTWVGGILGIPMVLGAVALFEDPKTLRGTPCTP